MSQACVLPLNNTDTDLHYVHGPVKTLEILKWNGTIQTNQMININPLFP